MHITDEVKSFLCLSPDNWQMTPGERSALIGLLERRHFDLALVDADHAEEAVAADVRHALQLADVILCHDAFYPATRRGIATAVRGADVFCDLEFVPGVLHRKGLFGGFALIIPGIGARERYTYEPRISAHPYLSLVYRWGRSLLWPLPRFRAWR